MFEAGVTVLGFPTPTPLSHEYVVTPTNEEVPVNVVEFPAQIEAGLAEAVTVGLAFTVTVTEDVPVHPFTSVPVTMYVLVEEGEAVREFPAPSPSLHTKEEAPEAVKVEKVPKQIIGGFAEAVTIGLGCTVTVTFAVPVHPFASVPVTV